MVSVIRSDAGLPERVASRQAAEPTEMIAALAVSARNALAGEHPAILPSLKGVYFLVIGGSSTTNGQPE
jgi:hypothetical protein